jgi:capsular exopolysaccharide synthesis family protein
VDGLKQAHKRRLAEHADGSDAAQVSSLPAPDAQAQPMPVGRGTPGDGIACHGLVPVVPASVERLVANRIVAMADHDPAATAYKVLRTHVLQRMRANHWKTLAITSPTQGNGKTVTSINLAITLARDLKHTVLLVDLDLRRPSLASFFFDEPVPGVSDYITDDRAIEELLINPGIERLTLLPGNHSFTHSSEILCSPKMIELVEELKGRYADRLVLFDMPPVLGGDDVMAFAPYVDAVLLVVEEGGTTKDELMEAYALLEGANILGTVLNKAEEGSAGAGYY